MKRRKALATALFLLLLGAALAGCGGTTTRVILPQDDAPHNSVDTEWWYYNGHLETTYGERYAFHYVVFEALTPDRPRMNVAHLSISDPQQDIHAIDQRMSLASSGGGDTPGFAFDIGGWRMSGYDGRDELSAFAHDYALRLNLEQAKSPVLHQRTGLVSLGEAGESYYYSRTRLVVSGTISVRGQEAPVTGLAWFDHQWGNFDPRPMRWDWFAVQLSDGSDMMLSVTRGEADQPRYRYGTFVTPDGAASHLDADQFQVLPTKSWTSSTSGGVYPAGWQLSVPTRGVDVALVPVLDHCEFDATSTTRNYYWEGEVTVSGSHSGRGFVELTGYGPSR